MNIVPQGWAEATLEDVCELLNGRAYKRDELLDNGKYTVLRVGNFFTSDKWFYSNLELDADKYCDTGDLLYAWSASFGPKIWTGGKVIYHYHIWRTRLNEQAVDKQFLYRWFQWDKENIKSDHGTGSTMIHVTKGDMEKRSLALPPLLEQRRIVAKIDSLTGKSKRARDHLDHIPRLVEKYKQAILAAAFRGDLTREWRPIDARTTTTNAPEDFWAIPETWRWSTVGQIGKVSLGRQRSPANHTGPQMRPYMRAANITWAGWNFSDVKEMNFDDRDFERFQLAKGDVLINEGSGSAKEVGKPAIWNDDIEDCCFQNTLLRVQPESCSSEYLYWYLRFCALDQKFVSSTQGVNIYHIGKDGLARFPIAVPPNEEQAEVVQRIEAALAWVDRLSADATSARKLIDHLDQAVLAKAFQGELVPQDPDDEPASVLLERIRAEREAAPRPKRGRRKAA